MKIKSKPIEELKRRLIDLSHLGSMQGLLGWDQEVYMPKKAADSRAMTIAHLSGLAHAKFLAINEDGLLTKLKKELDLKKLKGKDAVIVAEIWRDYERSVKLPEEFVREEAEATSKAQGVWAEARTKNDFTMFLPWLQKIVALKRREAQYIGYKDSPYDALIDQYEPGMTSAEAFQILNDLKDFLTPFVKEVLAKQEKINEKVIKGKFPLDKQIAFNKMVIDKIGFDLEAGRLDATTHPFASGFHPHDVRITTRYKEDDLLYSLGAAIHEAGHGMYEQGLPVEHFGTPLSSAVSLGIHESQSRMWENIIGKGQPFWKYFYPKLQKEFPIPYKNVSLDQFLKILNKVSPSLIRTESDEATYNLHIILCFELEKEIIEGTVDLKDLPQIWKAKMKEYFGINVPTDSLGVLQDVHWSCGLFGYFPTYSFGNLYSAQFYAAMKREIPDIEKQFAKGQFDQALKWLRKHIHSHGKTYTASQLVKRATGEHLTSAYFIDYLKGKYTA